MREQISEKTRTCIDRKACTESNINILDYEKLAYKYANKYIDYASKLGYELKDLEQIALLALCKAKKKYNKELGDFIPYAINYLRSELGNIVYINHGHTYSRKLRKSLLLVEDIDRNYNNEDDSKTILNRLKTGEEEVENNIWVEEYLAKVRFKDDRGDVFSDLLKHGKTETARRIVEKHGISVQSAYSRIRHLRKSLQEFYFKSSTLKETEETDKPKKIKGVFYNKHKEMWCYSFKHSGKKYRVDKYLTQDDAKKAMDEKKVELSDQLN